MELVLKDAKSVINVSDNIFSREFNGPLVHQVVVAYLASARQGSKAQKSRSEVIGSGKKPWRQKGTGHARAGSVKSPIWRGGGVTFAAKPTCHAQKVNKKMYQGAMTSILAELNRKKMLCIVEDGFSVEKPKTSLLNQKLKDMGFDKESVLIVTDKLEDNLILSSRNLRKVCVKDVQNVDPVSLISYDKVIMTVGALRQIEEKLA